MNDLGSGLLLAIILQIITVVLPSLINFAKTYAESRKLKADGEKARSESDMMDANTMSLLSKQVNELIQDKIEMNKRIDHLEKELKKYVNGYARAIRYIHSNIPNVEIPNFLETDPRIK